MKFNYGFATDVGRKRQQNQDNGAACPDIGLFMVADGMGGHRGGETASAISAEVVPQVVRKAQQELAGRWSARDLVKEAIQQANRAIFERALQQPGLQGMGTTTTALLFTPGAVTIGHVGDSRCYFFRPGAVWRVTRDHSLVEEKLRAGLITRAQLKNHQMKNVITRSVGFESEVNVEVYEMATQPGDVFLICSDGLSGQLEDEEMQGLIEKDLIDPAGGRDARHTVSDLIAAANEHGGDDNITAVVIQVLANGQGG